MVELIAEQSILLCQHGLKQTCIGIEAAGIEDGVFTTMKTRYLLFQFLVNGLRRWEGNKHRHFSLHRKCFVHFNRIDGSK